MEGKENAEVINNGELEGCVEPKEQDGPKTDAVEEKKPELKKKRKRGRQRKKRLKEEGINHNESGSTGMQLVVTADESIERKNVELSLKVYIGGIPYYPTDDEIRSYFEGCGTITSIDRRRFPNSGKFRGITIITYETEAAAKRAFALDGSNLGGLFLKIQPYEPATVNKLPDFSPFVVNGHNSIFIDNLSSDTTEDDLWKLFTDCAITSIRFGEDKENREFKGYVEFADGISLNTAFKLDQTIVCGRPVTIRCAVPKEDTGTQLITLPNSTEEDSRNKANTSKLEATPKDNEVDKSNVSVVENQVTCSWTNDARPKILCHLSSATVNKLPVFSPFAVDGHNSIFIDNLSSDTAEDDLWKLFADCAVTSIQFGEDKENGEFKGYVEFADGTSLNTACKLDQTIVCRRPVTIRCAVPKEDTGTRLITLPNDDVEDSGKKVNTSKLEATSKDKEVDKSNVSVVENHVISSGTNDARPKILCHLSSACPNKLAADWTIPEGQIIVSSEKGTGTDALISKKQKRRRKCRKPGNLLSSCLEELATDSTNQDNQDDSGKNGNSTKFEATPIDNEVDQSYDRVVVENQVTCSVTNALSLKKRKRTCYKCQKQGHLSPSCPKKLAADSTNPDNHDDSGRNGNSTKFEATPIDNEVDQSYVSIVVENPVTCSGTNAHNLKKRKRTFYKCRKQGHLSSSCPEKLAADSKNPDNQDDSGKGNFTNLESTRRNNEVDRSNVACRGRNALSSNKRMRTCYDCRERGHISSCCPRKRAAYLTNPVIVGDLLPIHGNECTSSADIASVGTTYVQRPIGSTLVRWLLPPYPWIKLNTDGCFDINRGVASGGGLIRDHLGDLQLAFYVPLEASSSFDAELQALLHGLHLAKQFNRPIWIELDALEVVRLLDTGRPGAWQTQRTLLSIRALMAQMQTWVTHIFREGNRPADYMATMGIDSNALHLVYTHSAPKHFMELVRMDQIGYPSFRVR